MASLPSIDLDISSRLKNDKEFRRRYFLAETSSLIAKQILALRKRRELNQKELAQLAGTKQPAISRAESADYQNWSFSTLRNIADALDARIRIIIEASEDVLPEYESFDSVEPTEFQSPLAAGAAERGGFQAAFFQQRPRRSIIEEENVSRNSIYRMDVRNQVNQTISSVGESDGTESYRLQQSGAFDQYDEGRRAIISAKSGARNPEPL